MLCWTLFGEGEQEAPSSSPVTAPAASSAGSSGPAACLLPPATSLRWVSSRQNEKLHRGKGALCCAGSGMCGRVWVLVRLVGRRCHLPPWVSASSLRPAPLPPQARSLRGRSSQAVFAPRAWCSCGRGWPHCSAYAAQYSKPGVRWRHGGVLGAGTGVPLPTEEVQELLQSSFNTSLGLGILSRAALTMPVVIMAMACCAWGLP